MATLEEIKAQKAAEIAQKLREEEEKLKRDAHDSLTIRSFFEQEMEREIKKTGFFKKLMYVTPLIIFIVMLGIGYSYIYFRDIITIRDANAQAYAIEAIGKATASAISQVGLALKQNPDYVPLTTAQKLWFLVKIHHLLIQNKKKLNDFNGPFLLKSYPFYVIFNYKLKKERIKCLHIRFGSVKTANPIRFLHIPTFLAVR
jgi:hypothetical protein